MALVADHRIATLVAGVITLAAGAVIIAIAPRAPLHRATGLFFGLRGGYLALVAFSSPFDNLAGRLSIYALIAIPFAAVWMAHRLGHDFGQRQPRHRSRVLAGFLIVILVMAESAYAFDHGLVFPNGPFKRFFELQFLTYAAITLAIAHEMRRAPVGPSRRALFTFMLGFAAEPVFWSSNILASTLQGTGRPDWGHIGAASAAIVTTLIALLVKAPLRHGERERSAAWTVLGVAIGVGILSSIAALYRVMPPYAFDPPTLNAAWTLWTVAATAYASLRYRLFDMDLRVKAFLRYGSTTFLLALVFWAASELIEANLHASNLWQSLTVAAVIGVLLYPLHRVTRRGVERLMPGVANTEEYRRRRREDIYLAAVERARTDGFVDEEEREALRMLGHGLGLSGRDMVRLEAPVTSSSA